MKLFLLYVLLFQSVYAKSPDEIAKEAHIASINTLLIFTGQEGLSSGVYNFSEIGVDMEIYHLPFTYHFQSDTNINYFLVGNVGYSRVYITDEIDIPSTSPLNYENHLRTYTGGIGGGVRYKFKADLSVSGGFEFIYSKSGASVKKPDDDIGDAIEDFFAENYNDNYSYKFFTNIEYRTKINEYKPYVILTYKVYETKSSFTFSDLSSFNSQSSVTTLSLGFETPSLLEFNSQYITLETYLNANYLGGTVKDVVEFDAYSTFGGTLYLYTPKGPWWASRFFLDLSTVNSSGLDGYNVGLGFTVDF